MSVELINTGKLDDAEAILNNVLTNTPRDFAGRLARGTARALARNLQGMLIRGFWPVLACWVLACLNTGAVEDFDVAVEVGPRFADGWKRRGQALAALDRHDAALCDLSKALELTTEREPQADILHERGMLHQKTKHFAAAQQDLLVCCSYTHESTVPLGNVFLHAGERAAECKPLRSLAAPGHCAAEPWGAGRVCGCLWQGRGAAPWLQGGVGQHGPCTQRSSPGGRGAYGLCKRAQVGRKPRRQHGRMAADDTDATKLRRPPGSCGACHHIAATRPPGHSPRTAVLAGCVDVCLLCVFMCRAYHTFFHQGSATTRLGAMQQRWQITPSVSTHHPRACPRTWLPCRSSRFTKRSWRCTPARTLTCRLLTFALTAISTPCSR